MKALVSDKFERAHIDSFAQALGAGWIVQEAGGGDLGAEAKDSDVLVAYNRDITAGDITAAQALKLVVRLGTAKGEVDVAALEARSIPYVTTESPALISVAEHAFMMMLALAKETVYSDAGVRAGLNPKHMEPVVSTQRVMAYNWLDLSKFHALYGKTVGIVGMGTCGKRLARMANSCDMEVIYYCRNRRSPAEEKEYNIKYVTFDELLARSDYISIHVKLNEDSTGMFGAEQFKRMKNTAYIVNTSRGPAIKEAELIEALQCGEIAGAGLDVFEIEPLPAASPLKKLDNVVLSAHSAGISLYKSLFTEFKFCAQEIKSRF